MRNGKEITYILIYNMLEVYEYPPYLQKFYKFSQTQ